MLDAMGKHIVTDAYNLWSFLMLHLLLFKLQIKAHIGSKGNTVFEAIYKIVFKPKKSHKRI